MRIARLLNAALLLALSVLPLAYAMPSVEPGAAAVQVLECRYYGWDSDRDGHAEAWQTCSTPPCYCMCPVVGGVIQLEAAGQEKNVLAFGSCTAGYGTSTESTDGSVGVRVTPIVNGGGLIAPVTSAIDIPELPSLPADANTAVALLDCRNYSWDYDNDGRAESWQTCSTPECGCMCPVAGAVVQLEALNQEQNVMYFGSCQSGYGRSTEGSDGSIGVRVTPFAYGGPIIATA